MIMWIPRTTIRVDVKVLSSNSIEIHGYGQIINRSIESLDQTGENDDVCDIVDTILIEYKDMAILANCKYRRYYDDWDLENPYYHYKNKELHPICFCHTKPIINTNNVDYYLNDDDTLTF